MAYTQHILFLLLSFSSLVTAVGFIQCFEDFKNNPDAIGGVDARGHPTNSAGAVGLTYETCTVLCGSGTESFSWKEFTRLVSSWLLPWLALISELPFDSENYVDDFISVTISVGSPALAAYSLMLTSINAQQVYRRAKQIDHRSKVAVTRALISLQQVPLELTKDERLLALLPINDQWSQEIASRLDWVRNAWPIATGLSIAWVLVSFLFALVDSFGSFDSTADGHAICTLWSWLLCLVIGWSWVPAFTSDELRPAIIHTNHRVARKAAKRIGQADPAHHQSTASLQIPPENEQPHGNPIIGANPTANQSDASVARSAASPIDPGTDGLLVSKMLTPLNRDEFRLAATFNYSRVMRYLLLVDDVFRTLDRITRKKDEKRRSVGEATPEPAGDAVFPPGALTSMFVALVLAIVLQCGTTFAAAIITIFTPTVGVGCRSARYILYGAIAIIIMFLTVISTILARISETCHERSQAAKRLIGSIAVALRITSYFLAFVNAAGLILFTCVQFSRFFDNCYCSSSVIGRGVDSYILANFEGWTHTMINSRIVGTIFSIASMATYMLSLWFISNSIDIDHL